MTSQPAIRRYLTVFLAALWVAPLIGMQADPIQQDLKKVVTFVFAPNDKGELVPNGTAFFVELDEHVTTNQHHAHYLVTARHVISAPNKSLLPLIVLRLNTKSGALTQAFIPFVTQGSEKNIFFNQDPTVDLAVIDVSRLAFLSHTPTDIDVVNLPPDIITTKKDFVDLKISEGTEVFFIGLFHSYFGTAHNYPIVRFGKVALITDERIDCPEPRPDSGTNILQRTQQDLYLLECTSTPGNSGSPVFFSFTEPGTPKFKLAGIMKGVFTEFEPIVAIPTANPSLASRSGPTSGRSCRPRSGGARMTAR